MKKQFGFDFSHFKGDLFGGITAGIVALPLALAFGEQSGMGAVAGLYGAIFIAFFAALFGGTSTQISGPTAPMTAVSVTVIASIVSANDGDLEKAIPAILMVFLLAGLIEIVLGLIKVGRYIRYISYPVISGFMTGIGVIILITQILPMIGYYAENDSELISTYTDKAKEVLLSDYLEDAKSGETINVSDYEKTLAFGNTLSDETVKDKATKLAINSSKGVKGTMASIGQAIKQINYIEFLLGILTILIIYGFKRITKVIPSSLVALLAVTIGAYFILGPSSTGNPDGYRTINQIPSGFPLPKLEIITGFSFSQVSPFISYAFSLALLGAIDSLLTSIVADNMTKTKHDPNKELVGQGIGNSVAAIFGGIPGAGATIRTVVNIEAGGKTKLSGMVAGVLLLVVLVSLGPLASQIPAAVLAGILVTVGIGVMDYRGLRQIPETPKSEVFVMLVVLVLTVFVGLIEAVTVGMILSSVLFMKTMSDVVDHKTKTAPLNTFPREIPWADEGDIVEKFGDEVYIKHLDGPLFFGFASRFQDMMKAIPNIKAVVIRMDKVPYVDQSGIYAMEDAIEECMEQNIKIVFVDLHGQPLDMFEKFKIVPNLVENEYCFNTFEDCSKWLETYLKENH